MLAQTHPTRQPLPLQQRWAHRPSAPLRRMFPRWTVLGWMLLGWMLLGWMLLCVRPQRPRPRL
jgi:type VI protein secretion system component VasF